MKIERDAIIHAEVIIVNGAVMHERDAEGHDLCRSDAREKNRTRSDMRWPNEKKYSFVSVSNFIGERSCTCR